jgi:hypothetical protein
LLAQIAEIDEFKSAWRLGPTCARSPLQPAACGEGAKVSDREVERLLSSLEIEAFASRDEQEVVGWAAVMETIFTDADAIDLTENHIKQIHRDLVSTRAGVRRGPLRVGAGPQLISAETVLRTPNSPVRFRHYFSREELYHFVPEPLAQSA